MSKVFIFSEKISVYPELVAGGKALGGDVVAFVVGDKAAADEVASYGAKVYHAEGGKMLEDYYATIKATVEKEAPGVVLIGTTKAGRVIAGRLAASLGTTALTDLSNIEMDGGAVKGTQMYYGGVALTTLKSKGSTAVVTVGSGAWEPAAKGGAGEVVAADVLPSDTKIVRKEVRKKEGEAVDLSAAKRVVGVGRGMGAKEDLAMIEELAKLMEAEVGCTRPIAEGEGWMGVERYIGVSGVMLKPDFYVSIGISGQIQHTIGINTSRVVVAINKDKNAPIFKECDYGIVGDLYKVVPALNALLKG